MCIGAVPVWSCIPPLPRASVAELGHFLTACRVCPFQSHLARQLRRATKRPVPLQNLCMHLQGPSYRCVRSSPQTSEPALCTPPPETQETRCKNLRDDVVRVAMSALARSTKTETTVHARRSLPPAQCQP